LNRLLIL